MTQSDTRDLPDETALNYRYDLDDRLISASSDNGTTKMQYLPDGLRYQKTQGSKTTRYMYDHWNQVVSDQGSAGSQSQSTYVRGDRVLVKKDLTNKKEYYYLYNGHGDVVQLIATDGTLVNSYQYDEWGNTTAQKETVANEFKYAGETYDAETGLYYLKARYYDPAQGRFLNEDTYEGQIDNPLSLNVYTYVHNNPLIYVDPSGHSTDPTQERDTEGNFSGGVSASKGGGKNGGNGKSSSKNSGSGKSTTSSNKSNKTDKDKIEESDVVTESDSATNSDKLREELRDEKEYRENHPKFPENRQELHDELIEKGYVSKGTTDGGYVEYKHADGTTVWIRPDGEVITTKREWLPDHSKKITKRYTWDGKEVENGGHNTGEYVEPLDKATYVPPKKIK